MSSVTAKGCLCIYNMCPSKATIFR